MAWDIIIYNFNKDLTRLWILPLLRIKFLQETIINEKIRHCERSFSWSVAIYLLFSKSLQIA